MNEDVNTVSPTLGFIIKTIEYKGSRVPPGRIYLVFPYMQHVQRGNTLSGDVGGQKTLRSYWKNYFEKTDALIWVVDATDRLRINDCRDELAGLLLEEVSVYRDHENYLAASADCPIDSV
ncbi:MAG: hypothetical protein M1829_005755 [Trizodia sp. TS-e1964]|nr:MAG: hypothetical protein M1829_005755 [Trizodia sp. TS-e1964]